MKAELPPCGLYFRVEEDPVMDRILPAMRQAAFVINRSDYEKNMHVMEIQPGPEGTARENAAALIQLAKMEGLVAILKGDAATAAALDADGVLLDNAGAVESARALMGDKILGLVCGDSRMAADRARAAGVDYVTFGVVGSGTLPSPSLFQWWSTLTDIPSLACGSVTNDDAATYVTAGATFLDCSDYVWDHPKGVMQGVTNMLYAIELAFETVRKN